VNDYEEHDRYIYSLIGETYSLIGEFVKVKDGQYGQIRWKNGLNFIEEHEGEWIIEMSDGQEWDLNQDAFEVISKEEYIIGVVMDT